MAIRIGSEGLLEALGGGAAGGVGKGLLVRSWWIALPLFTPCESCIVDGGGESRRENGGSQEE